MSDIQKVKQLPTSTNLDNLSLEQIGEFANRKGRESEEYRIRSAISAYECGQALIAARIKVENEQGKRKFLAWLQVNWHHSRDRAYKFIQFVENPMCIQLVTHSPDLSFNAAQKALKELDSGEKTQLEIDDEAYETVEAKVTEIKQEFQNSLTEAQRRLIAAEKKEQEVLEREKAIAAREKENQQVLKADEQARNQIKNLQAEIDKLQSRFVELATERPQIIEKVVDNTAQLKLLASEKQKLENEKKNYEDKLNSMLASQVIKYEEKLEQQKTAYYELLARKNEPIVTEEELIIHEKLHHKLDQKSSKINFDKMIVDLAFTLSKFYSRTDLYDDLEMLKIKKIIDFIQTL